MFYRDDIDATYSECPMDYNTLDSEEYMEFTLMMFMEAFPNVDKKLLKNALKTEYKSYVQMI